MVLQQGLINVDAKFNLNKLLLQMLTMDSMN
jgi:hypothetical protein